MNETFHSEEGRTRAEIRRSRWPGWIWALPIAVLLLVGWLFLRYLFSGGEDITISFDDVHGLNQSNASVLYRGMAVGKVTEMTLADDGKTVNVGAHIENSATEFLNSGTEFWLRGANPSISDLSSLSSVLSGPTIIMEAGTGEKTRNFVGLVRKPVVASAHDQSQVYGAVLEGSVGELHPGDPVKLRGFTVGEVKDVGFRYDAKADAFSTPVTISLYPSLFRLGSAPEKDGKAALKTAIDDLIRKGLRARLEREPPLIGAPHVTLAIESGEPAATPVVVNDIPQIPASAGGGAGSIVERVNKLPLDQIAQNVLDTTRQAKTLLSSPRLADAIAQLDVAVTQISQTASSSGPKLAALVDSLHLASAQLDDVLKAAKATATRAEQAAGAAGKILGGASEQNGIQTAITEVVEAARSVRELASYLDRHPEALVKGRSGE